MKGMKPPQGHHGQVSFDAQVCGPSHPMKVPAMCGNKSLDKMLGNVFGKGLVLMISAAITNPSLKSTKAATDHINTLTAMSYNPHLHKIEHRSQIVAC